MRELQAITEKINRIYDSFAHIAKGWLRPLPTSRQMARTWSAGKQVILHNHVDESWRNTAISYDTSTRKVKKLVLKNSLGIDLSDSELA